jgi:hypothetical protein
MLGAQPRLACDWTVPELMIGCKRRRSIHLFSVAKIHPLRLPTPKKTPG